MGDGIGIVEMGTSSDGIGVDGIAIVEMVTSSEG